MQRCEAISWRLEGLTWLTGVCENLAVLTQIQLRKGSAQCPWKSERPLLMAQRHFCHVPAQGGKNLVGIQHCCDKVQGVSGSDKSRSWCRALCPDMAPGIRNSSLADQVFLLTCRSRRQQAGASLSCRHRFPQGLKTFSITALCPEHKVHVFSLVSPK